MPTLQALQPYVEQLFEDSDVQRQLSRAAANFRGAGTRAGSAKSKRDALQDAKLRQRLLDGARAGVAAGVGLFGGAGVFALFAFGALTAAAIAALATAVATWLAALIVAIVWAAIAGIAALTGKKKVEQALPPVPEDSVESVKEDVQWTK